MSQSHNDADDTTLIALEFPAVVTRIAGYSTCATGKSAVLSARPQFGNQVYAQAELALVDDAVRLFQTGASIGFGGVADTLPMLERIEKGASLSAAELRQLAIAERSLRTACATVRADRNQTDALRTLADERNNSDEMISAVNQAIDEEGHVIDEASSALTNIRRQQGLLHEQVRERCRSIIHKAELAKFLSEPIVTIRGGRYVVPVRSEFASQFPGVVHDQSASGVTVFMEPLASVEDNNRLRTLEAAEEREVARILSELSARARSHAQDLNQNARLLARLDSIAARARWAIALNAGQPAFVDTPSLRIVQGRHPLLRHEAVPLTVDLGDGIDAIVISGPNMGGKTVVLKTIGLFVLLAYAGISLPAAAGTTIGNFNRISCVIGDEQSIAEDVSSFSAHVRALKQATEHAGQRSLVLVDEIGSGTEPGAGAALAQAFIEAMMLAGTHVVVTTHFTQLKTFAAAHDRVRNASMLFDSETNAPTYVFLMGVPGQSLAFSLARAMRFDPRIIERAETLLGIDAQNLERAFEKLAHERNELRRKQQDLDAEQSRLQRLETSARQKVAALEEERQAFERRASAALEQAVAQVRRELAERAQKRGEVAQRQAAKPAVDSERVLAETLSEMRRSLGLERSPQGISSRPSLSPGDSVYVRNFDKTGVVSEVYRDDVLVTIGSMKTLVPISEVVAHAGKNAVRAAVSAASRNAETLENAAESGVTTAVDVRGMRVDEAWPLIDKALDNAALVGLNEFRIVHGKGTGRLSHGIREFLAGHPQVESTSFAGDREGGSGVTVVRLK